MSNSDAQLLKSSSASNAPTKEPSVEDILNSAATHPHKLPGTHPNNAGPSTADILQSAPKVGQSQPSKATILSLTPIQQKDTHIEPVKLVNTSGKYRIASKIQRPNIIHDGGFVGRYGRRKPTAADERSRALWKAKLNAAEATCGPVTGPLNPLCNYEDLTDALAAYRYFWEGNGKDRYEVNYERYLASDASAKDLVKRLVDDFTQHVEVIGKNRTRFQVSSDQYAIGENGFAEYPKSVNWQRTLGAHLLWVSATVTASVKSAQIAYSADMIIHMEDRYNFNPHGTDIGSGKIKDEENGAFEMVGWANGYMNYAAVARKVRWIERAGKAVVIEIMPIPPIDKSVNSMFRD